MTGLERARSIDQWAQALLSLGIFAGGVAGMAIGFATGEPLIAIISTTVGLLLGWLASYAGTLVLLGIATTLRELDAVARDVEAMRRGRS